MSSAIKVAATSNDGSTRKWDKKQFCYYCSEPQAKLPRHLDSVHRLEPDVVLLRCKSGKSRKQQLCKLRNLGNHLHNSDVLRKGEGTLIVAYRPSNADENPNLYGPCPHCYGYYVRRDLWKHKCPFRPDASTSGNGTSKRLGRVAMQSDLLKPSPITVSSQMKTILGSMKKDNVSMAVKTDKLIQELGLREFMKVGHDPAQHNYARTKLREISRLLLQLRKNTGKPNASLESFIDPKKMKDIIAAVHDVAGFNQEHHTFSVPSLSLKLGHTLKKCAVILKAQALETGDKEKESLANDFRELCECTWEVQVSTHALRTLGNAKRNNPMVLPTNADVVRMSQYLRDFGAQQLRLLCDDDSFAKDAWNLPSEVTLCQMIIFNRRRQGEVSKMKVDDFKKKHMAKPDGMCILSKVEQGLCKMLEVVEIVGKRGRTVPMLLTPEMTKKMTVLLENREHAGVATDNEYMFARSSYQSLGYIRGSDCLRKHASLAGVVNPQCLRSTKLWKHIATASQMLALTEQQMELLASFMGHDLRVHREYYQVPDTVLRVAKLSKLFIALEKGTLPSQEGKTLDDLSIEDANSGN